MPVPIPGLKVGSDNQKVKILTIFGRPKTGIFRRFRGVPGGPNPLDMDTLAAWKGYPGDTPGVAQGNPRCNQGVPGTPRIDPESSEHQTRIDAQSIHNH
jgi:hypothetical protein